MKRSKHITTPPRSKHKYVYFMVFSLIKNGYSLKDICQKLGLKKQSLNRYIKRLKASGSIRKLGYGVWEALNFNEKEVNIITLGSPAHHPPLYKEIRGHAFTFTLKIPKIYAWKRRKEYLEKNNIEFKDFKTYQRITIREHKIWLADKSITIYTPKNKSYFAENSTEAEATAINNIKEIIVSIENLLHTSFLINKQYHFKVCRHHFARIQDQLAKKCSKDKVNIKLENGWFIIDNSFNLHEAETLGAAAIPYMDTYQNFIRSLIEKPFTAYDFEKMYLITKEMTLGYEQNIKLHLETLNDIRNTLKDIRDLKK